VRTRFGYQTFVSVSSAQEHVPTRIVAVIARIVRMPAGRGVPGPPVIVQRC
jgi:hypothetical protein